MMIITQLKIIA